MLDKPLVFKSSNFILIKTTYSSPGLFSGIRVGACFAPIGAVVGEWIGGVKV